MDRIRILITFVVLAVATVPLGLSSRTADAGHTLGHPAVEGDCWRPDTAYLCRNTWAQGANLYLLIIDEVTGPVPGWADNMLAASNNWESAVGPLYIWYSDPGGASWVYYKFLGSITTVVAATYNCSPYYSPNCSVDNVAKNIYWSEVKIQAGNMNALSEAKKTNVFAHELGHTLGLWHHSGALMNASVTTQSWPTSTDFGALPPCSGANEANGIRCIFNWQ